MEGPHPHPHRKPAQEDDLKILPANDTFVVRLLRDFRVIENGRRMVARLQGEGRFGSSVFPELAERNRKVLVEFLAWEEWKGARPSLMVRWFQALRIPYLAFSLFPLLLVVAHHFSTFGLQKYREAFLMILAVSLLHLGCNLWNDYEDHMRGLDSPDNSGGSGAIRNLWIPAIHIRNAAAAFFLLGLVVGFLLLFMAEGSARMHLLGIGLLGSLAAASYSGWPFHYKYLGLGEPIVFLLGGPLITYGAATVLHGGAYLWFILSALPLSFLAVLRLHVNNMQRTPFNAMAGTRTIASMVGFKVSRWLVIWLLAAPFLTALLLMPLIGKQAILPLLSLPFAIFPARLAWKASGPLDPACGELRKSVASFHLAFGALWVLSFSVVN